MFRAIAGRLLAMLFVGVLVLTGTPALAQSTGRVSGRVVDGEGNPVQDATITIELTEGVTRRFETKSNQRGEFRQIGLPPGMYRVTADKAGLGALSHDIRISAGGSVEVNIQLAPGMGMAPSEEDLKRIEAIKELFEEGVTFSRDGNYRAAIEKFEEAVEISPNCFDCTYNIGVAHTQLEEYDEAETMLKKTLEINPSYHQAYSALANIYNAQRRFDEAVQASQQADRLSGTAAGGGSVESVYNQAVIMWNAGQVADAKEQFRRVVSMQADHADAHYWLGMANLNEGNLPEAVAMFQEYLKLDPEGQYAAQAQGIVEQLKQ